MSLWVSPHFPEYSYFTAAGIASDHVRCSEFARDIMIEGGNAVEGAIAIMICLGVINPMSSGLGGGHFMTIYNATTHKCSVVDAREVAPLNSHKNVFDDDPSESETGWKAVAVPGELHGLWTEYRNFGGNLPWSRLLEPTIKMMETGVPVSQALESALEEESHSVRKDKALLRDFANPKTGKFFKTGDIMKNREELLDTLKTLARAKDPVKEFYRGKLTKQFVEEFRENGGIITAEDFRQYKALVKNQSEIIVTQLNGRYICGPPPPSSSAVTQSIIKIMDDYATGFHHSKQMMDVDTYHYYLEASKFAYATRADLGDANFVPESLNLARHITSDSFVKSVRSSIKKTSLPTIAYNPKFSPAPDSGTSSFMVLDSQGNAVATTTTINFLFGAGVASESTGIIWNSNMDDFSAPKKPNFYGYPPSPANFVEPGKRPMSSISPLIVINKATKKPELIVGAAGGSRIISTVSSIATKVLNMKWRLRDALNSARLHNQLFPNVTLYEPQLTKHFVEKLTDRGHSMHKLSALSEATGIYVDEEKIYVASDFRQGVEAQPSGY